MQQSSGKKYCPVCYQDVDMTQWKGHTEGYGEGMSKLLCFFMAGGGSKAQVRGQGKWGDSVSLMYRE